MAVSETNIPDGLWSLISAAAEAILFVPEAEALEIPCLRPAEESSKIADIAAVANARDTSPP